MLAYSFGPFRLIPDQRLLERDGVAVPLTAKALDLLVTLVRHRSRALSKDEILSMVWPGLIVEDGNLAQQVHLLRRALAEAGDCIATVPRHGYRFVAAVTEDASAAPVVPVGPHSVVWDDRLFVLREGQTVIGRAEDAEVQLLLPSVSRHHARIVVKGASATLEDLGSRHGTWRNGARVTTAVALHTGDDITLGSARLTYRCISSADTTL